MNDQSRAVAAVPDPGRSLSRFVSWSLPAFALLFAVHVRNSLAPLLAARVPPDLGYSAQAIAALQLLQVATIAYLFALYFRTLARWPGGHVTARALAPVIVVLTLAAWTLLPANSSDILEYLGYGRLSALYGLNPYTHSYGEITDRFATYVSWDDPMPYGPPLLPLFMLGGLLSAVHVLLGIYALKLIWAGVHLLDAWMLYRIARRLTGDPARAVFTFACNPLILLETVGNGHNDGVLIACGLGAILALLEGRRAAAVAVAFAGAVIKLGGLFWLLPIAALLVFRRQWRSLAWGSVGAAALASVVVAWPGCLAALTVLNSQWRYSEDSLHSIVLYSALAAWARVSDAASYDVLFRIDRLCATPLMLAYIGWRLSAVRDAAAVVRESGYLMLVLLLAYAVAVEPWYFTWLLPVAALTDSPRVRWSALLCGVTALALYAFPYAVVEPLSRHYVAAYGRLLLAFALPLTVLLLFPQREWVAGRLTRLVAGVPLGARIGRGIATPAE